MIGLKATEALIKSGKEVSVFELDEADHEKLDKYLSEYCNDLGIDYEEVKKEKFVKLVPVSHRPYGNLYATC